MTVHISSTDIEPLQTCASQTSPIVWCYQILTAVYYTAARLSINNVFNRTEQSSWNTSLVFYLNVTMLLIIATVAIKSAWSQKLK